ncbi:hypothetical protein KAT51_03910 [bacterium]|nr:hypothetical protein [bacterium]
MEYPVKYVESLRGSVGLFGKGLVCLEENVVYFQGRKHWSGKARIAIFIIIAVLLGPFMGIGFLIAALVIHYACASPTNLKIPYSNLSDIVRLNSKIRVKIRLNNKAKNLIFISKENASDIERQLKEKITDGTNF